jgi:putative transposase
MIPAFLGEPETNGCAERWIRTLKDQCLWTTLHDTIDKLRQAAAGSSTATTAPGSSNGTAIAPQEGTSDSTVSPAA